MLKCGTLASCKSLEFPETPKLPPLGRSKRLGGNSSDAVQTSLQATEAQTTFLLSRAFEALYSAGKHFGAKQKRTPTDSGRQGTADPGRFSRGGCSPRPQVGVPRTTKPVAGFLLSGSTSPAHSLLRLQARAARERIPRRGWELVWAPGQLLWTIYASDRKTRCWPSRQLPAFRQSHGAAAAAAASRPVPARREPGPARGKDARSQGRGPLRLQAGLGSAGAGSALLGWRWGAGQVPRPSSWLSLGTQPGSWVDNLCERGGMEFSVSGFFPFQEH